jgi:mRNA interferase RelE/StbE
MWVIKISENARNQLLKMNPTTAALIVGYLKMNLENQKDPRRLGVPFKGKRQDQWRYSFGDYRILCSLENMAIIVFVINYSQRLSIYK